VLVQLNATGWQLMICGQLIPYTSGVYSQLLASQTILNRVDTTKLQVAQFCLGYGTTAAEMTSAGKMREAVDLNSLQVANGGSCNVAANPPPLLYKGLFWNASESGWGMSITQHASGNIFLAWYAYDASSMPIWYVTPACSLSGKTCTSDIYSVVGGTAPGVT
jgi:hypothetical protein